MVSPDQLNFSNQHFIPLNAILNTSNSVASEFKPRKLNWPVPTNTRHREYTVTEKCYLIQAGDPCSGCTIPGNQDPEAGVYIDSDLPSWHEDSLSMNVGFVTAVSEREVEKGINLLTYMGGEPLTIKKFSDVVSWVTHHPVLNGLIYSSSAYFFEKEEKLGRRFSEYEEAGLFLPNFGYFKASVDLPIFDKKEIPPRGHPLHGDAFKSYFGLKLAEELAKRGYQTAIHQTLKTYTIDHTLLLYKWARERGIRFSMCPTVWARYVQDGVPEEKYSHHLTRNHEGQLKEITDQIIGDTINRFQEGKKRIFVASSAFARLMPKYGPLNTLSCKVHRQGRQPNGQDIHTNGQERWCIAQNKEEQGHRCTGCYYIGIDRDGDYWNLEHLANLSERDTRFLNADVWIKDPIYDPTGRNLFFDAKGQSLVIN